MKKLICAALASWMLCLGAVPAYAQQAVPAPTGLEALFQLIAAIQALVNALNALGGLGTPVQNPPPPPPPMMPIDPNMFIPPIDPIEVLPIGCDISFFPIVDLGESFFLPEFEAIAGFPNRIGYASPRELDAVTIEGQNCPAPGIGIRVFSEPTTPLQFTGVNGGPFPSLTTRSSPIVYVASDTKQRGICRPGELFQGPGLGTDCFSVGRVEYVFDERIRMDSPSTWGMVDGLSEISTVTLLIFTPSPILAGSPIFF